MARKSPSQKKGNESPPLVLPMSLDKLPAEFHDLCFFVRQAAYQLFSAEYKDAMDSIFTYMDAEDRMTRYIYFTPEHYFNRKAITHELLKELRDGKKMLSVGAGPAQLERFLVQEFSLPEGSVSAADIEIHPRLSESKLPTHRFDMTLPWPEDLPSFDVLLFPESLGVSVGMEVFSEFKEYPSEEIQSLSDELYRTYDPPIQAALKKFPKDTRKFIQLMMNPRNTFSVLNALRTLEHGLGHLLPQGRIIVIGSCLQEPMDDFFYELITHLHPDYSVDSLSMGSFILRHTPPQK